MNKHTGELLKLIEENPELPIVPMVDSEIVADDDFNRWMGSFGSACIDEYITGGERVYFRDDDKAEKVIAEILGWDAYEVMTSEEAKREYAKLPWIKAIIVNIDLPD